MDAAHAYNQLNPLQLKIKRIMVKRLARKAAREADKVWDEKGWTNETMEEMLNTHYRTPYNPYN